MVRLTSIRTSVSLLLSCWALAAEPPTLDYVFPAGGQQGTTNTITIGGKFEPWPAKMWIDCEGVGFEAQTNKGTFKASIATNTPLGPHLLRVFNSEGASAPKWFVIGGEQELAEGEPNDTWKQAQRITNLPIVVNGRLEKSGDVDSFAVQLAAGKWLIASVDGYALGSPIDPNLALLDEHGHRVAFNSDGRNSCDPLLEYEVHKTGTYILQVTAFAFPPAADVRLAGAAGAVYRLTITQGPFVRAVSPAPVTGASKTELTWETINPPAKLWSDARVIMPASFYRFPHVISDLGHQVEHEPNNSADQAQSVQWPVTINGKIDPPGDQDQFAFKAKKGEKIELRLRSAQLGLPLDATLRIDDVGGKQIVRDDDSGEGSDPLLNWTAPSNGTYRVVVADLYRRGGPEFVYALDIHAPIPDFKVSVDSSVFRIEPGKTNEIKLTVSRMAGHSNKLEISIHDLPQGVTFKASPISAKDKEAKLLLIAATNAPLSNGPFQIDVTESTSSLTHHATFDLGPKESRFGEMLIPKTDQLWLTVGEKAAEPAKSTKSK